MTPTAVVAGDRPVRTFRTARGPRAATALPSIPRLVLAALLLLAAPSAAAHHGTADALYPLAGHARVLVDASARLDVDAVVARLDGPEFRLLGDREQRFGYTPARLWIDARVPAALAGRADLRVLVPSPLLDEVRLVHLRDGRVVADRRTGLGDALVERPVPSRGYVLPVDDYRAESDRLLLALRTRGNLTVGASLTTAAGADAWAEAQRDTAILFHGAMGTLLVLNLLLFALTRIRALLYYCLFVGATMGHHAFYADVLALAAPDLPMPWAHRAFVLCILVSGIASILFTRHALVLRRSTPNLDRAILGIGAVTATVAVLLPLLEVGTGYRLAAGLAMIANPVLIAAAVARWRQGDRTARTLLVAWGLLLAGITLMALYRVGLLPTAVITEQGTYLLSAGCALLLSFGVIQRLLLLEDEERQATAELAEGVRGAAADGDLMIEELDRSVRQRNRELRAANERLQAIRDETELHAQTLDALFTSSASIHRSVDADALLRQSLDELAVLFPRHAFGILIHGVRPGDLRQRAFVRFADGEEQRIVDQAERLIGGDLAQVRSLLERQGGPDDAVFQFVALGVDGDGVRSRAGQQATRGHLVIRGPGLPQRSLDVLSVFGTQIATAIENRRLSAELEELANTDPLTGLGNRTVFDAAIARARAHASSRPRIHFAVLVCDVNGLKQMNDGHGHEAGDRLLQSIAEVLAACVRREDMVTRTGGDEFIIVCPGARPETGEELAGRIDSQLARTRLRLKVGARVESFAPSVSVGTASSHDLPSDQVVATADARMYDAKERHYATLDLGADGRPLPAAEAP